MVLPKLTIRKTVFNFPIIQGGMGIGYANHVLSGNVSKEGGLGVMSSAGLDRLVSSRKNIKVKCREATAIEVQDAKAISRGAPVGMNIMVALVNQYEDSVLGSMDGGVDVIISGAGLPISLPAIASTHPRFDDVALVPIVCTGRALKILIRKWSKSGRLPDAVVVEGPLAGGHIGWTKKEDAFLEKNTLENLVEDVLSVAKPLGIPVIAAGGVHNHEDIQKYLSMGCVGIQMGTRFLATHESGASQSYKKKIVECTEKQIKLADAPGSPCGLLFRVIETSPFYIESVNREREVRCDKGYVLNKNQCHAKESKDSFCICNGLMASSYFDKTSEKELYTIGARGFEIDKIVSVRELMEELIYPLPSEKGAESVL